MATGTAATNARQYSQQLVHYVKKTINYNDTGISSGVATGVYLPAGAIITGTDCVVEISFNAASTNVLTAGLNGTTANNIIQTITATSAAFAASNHLPTGTAIGPLTADSQIYIKYTQTGTAGTAGKAHFIIRYVVNNDG